MEITVKRPGISNLMAHICRELRIAHYINRMVTWDEKQWKASPGSLIVGLVINMLVHRTPLYRVERFFEGMDMPLLFDEDLMAENFNDDALGRALDRLSEIDGKQLLHTVACRAVSVDNMEIKTVHVDTTSRSVYGEYEYEKSDDIKHIEITYGHSKDFRPDLKQIKFGLMVTREGFPLIGTVDSGNKNDGVWNKEILSEFETSMLEYWKVVYVADSALITTDNLRTMHEKGIRFISLLPSRYNLAQDLRDQAWVKGEWTYQGTFSEKKNAAKYWTQSMEADVDGKTYRFIVVRSSNLDKRKEKRLQNQLEKEKQELQKLKKSLDKEIFQCRPDAESRLREVISAHKMLHGLSGKVVEQRSVKRKPGRPKQGEEPEVHITYGIELDIHDPTEEVLTEWRQKEATFVLITTESEERMSDREVLAEYKGQSSVEMRFSFLKDPMFVDGIFLKTPKRVEALGYVILLAVCVAAFLERRIRERLKEENTTIIAPGKRILNRPTIQVILDMLNEMNVAYLSDEEGTRRYLPDNTSKEIIKLVRLAGYDEQIYLRKT